MLLQYPSGLKEITKCWEFQRIIRLITLWLPSRVPTITTILKSAVKGVKLRYTSTQEGVMKMPVTQQVEQIFAMIHGITWLLPMGMVSKFLWMGQKDLIGLHTMAC